VGSTFGVPYLGESGVDSIGDLVTASELLQGTVVGLVVVLLGLRAVQHAPAGSWRIEWGSILTALAAAAVLLFALVIVQIVEGIA